MVRVVVLVRGGRAVAVRVVVVCVFVVVRVVDRCVVLVVVPVVDGECVTGGITDGVTDPEALGSVVEVGLTDEELVDVEVLVWLGLAGSVVVYGAVLLSQS